MSKIEGCIFDLDGVIVDTAKYHYLAWKRLANELGFKFTEEQNERLKGVSRMKSLDILLEIGNLNFSDKEKIELAEKKNNWYVEYISNMDSNEILPGAKEFLQIVRDNGMKTALGSVSKNSMTILNGLNLAKYFDAIIDGNKVTHAKPNPEVFLLGAKEIGVPQANCVVFEDAVSGIEAAINAEMYSIGIGSKKVLSRANIVIDSLADMKIGMLDLL
ncbi:MULTISPECIES: beta-phosphoglucomutase [Clostridium]|uniref:beta-phosphoglucomutase n=1 Tax=Clostridium TaxID=1485 RepID=UPI00069DDD8C|nr:MULTISPECIES: beta-phosphoglucomutase [Clostridium]KOF56565.1 beta-phosphoglucomutase [Clostridium sp. DMHC 10]MCD2346414.1 beta-phosphoglucomutase [Clostridium guangxiense]